MVIINTVQNSAFNFLQLSPLPYKRPLLAIGHGTRNDRGRQTFLDFVETYQKLDTSRPVIPCFLELTKPTIQEGIEACIQQLRPFHFPKQKRPVHRLRAEKCLFQSTFFDVIFCVEVFDH